MFLHKEVNDDDDYWIAGFFILFIFLVSESYVWYYEFESLWLYVWMFVRYSFNVK